MKCLPTTSQKAGNKILSKSQFASLPPVSNQYAIVLAAEVAWGNPIQAATGAEAGLTNSLALLTSPMWKVKIQTPLGEAGAAGPLLYTNVITPSSYTTKQATESAGSFPQLRGMKISHRSKLSSLILWKSLAVLLHKHTSPRNTQWPRKQTTPIKRCRQNNERPQL